MKPETTTLLRSKGLAMAVHLVLWVLLALVILRLGGAMPPYTTKPSDVLPSSSIVPVARLDTVFSPEEWPSVVLHTNAPSAFFTDAFVPAPKPPPPPPPPPPTTRKVALTYQGFYETAGGPRLGMVKTETGFTQAGLGVQVITNHFVAEISMHGLTLTNTAAQTNLLLLNIPKELEIPIK